MALMVKSRRARSSSSETPYSTTAWRPSVRDVAPEGGDLVQHARPVDHADRAVLHPDRRRCGGRAAAPPRGRGRGGEVEIGVRVAEQGVPQRAADAPGLVARAPPARGRSPAPPRAPVRTRGSSRRARRARRPRARWSAPSAPATACVAPRVSRPSRWCARRRPRTRRPASPVPTRQRLASTTGFPSSIQRRMAGTAPGGMFPLPNASTTTPS